jgi:hypothetical protein
MGARAELLVRACGLSSKWDGPERNSVMRWAPGFARRRRKAAPTCIEKGRVNSAAELADVVAQAIFYVAWTVEAAVHEFFDAVLGG